MTDTNRTRDERGYFLPGNPGGPGRPRGPSRRELDQTVRDAVPDLINLLLEKSKAGDIKAIELLLSRGWPAPKGRTIPVNLPRVRSAENVMELLDAINEAVGCEIITPDEAASLSTVIARQLSAVATAKKLGSSPGDDGTKLIEMIIEELADEPSAHQKLVKLMRRIVAEEGK